MIQGILEPGVGDSLGSGPHWCGVSTRTYITAVVIKVALPDFLLWLGIAVQLSDLFFVFLFC